MSVLIKGMEMPMSCTECPCYDDMETSFCNVIDSYCEQYKTERHPNCPLVAVPTPHGRLIDADRLLSIIKSAAGDTCSVLLNAVIDLIEHASVVVEKETKQR